MARLNQGIGEVMDLNEQLKTLLGSLNRSAAMEEFYRDRCEAEGSFEDELPRGRGFTN
jgi:hypothetical protein